MDSNNNPKEDVQDVSNGVIRKKAQMDHEGNVADPAEDDHENVPDTTITEDSEDDTCMVRDYEKMSVDIV